MKIKSNPFTTKHKGNVVEVWLGKPDELESEFILAVDQAWLPALIAILKSTVTPKITVDITKESVYINYIR